MSSNRYKYFRWTPRTALISFNYVVLVPGILGYFAYSTEVGVLFSFPPFEGLGRGRHNGLPPSRPKAQKEAQARVRW